MEKYLNDKNYFIAAIDGNICKTIDFNDGYFLCVSGYVHIEGKPADQDAKEGSRVRIVCKTSSDPELGKVHIKWYINSELLNISKVRYQMWKRFY